MAIGREAVEHTGVGDSLTVAEVDALAAAGGPGAAAVLANWGEAIEQAKRAGVAAETGERLLAGSMSLSAAADELGVAKPELLRRIATRDLYAFQLGGEVRLPRWQFHHGRPLPHLLGVVSAIPDGAHPFTVHMMMTTPQDEVDGLTPVGHLAAGGNPAPVAALLDSLIRW